MRDALLEGRGEAWRGEGRRGEVEGEGRWGRGKGKGEMKVGKGAVHMWLDWILKPVFPHIEEETMEA